MPRNLSRLLAILCLACGGSTEVSTESEQSIASLEVIRGAQDQSGRRLDYEEVTAPGLTRLRLDSGPRLLLEDATFTLNEDGSLRLSAGRAFVDVLEGQGLEVHSGEHILMARDASLSLIAGESAYVIRGEVAHRHGEVRDQVRGGESLDLASGEVSATALWSDWTGGLARPGPGLGEDVAIGALQGRVPDEVGRARWPLVIRHLNVRVRVVDDLAITEVDQVFFNPASETVEGLYQVRVPDGALLQRFSVDRDGRMVDGYVREKAQAQQAYERQVYRGSTLDPALLEWKAPGRYQARIYPIAPGAERRIAIRYAEWLPRANQGGEEAGARIYRFPMSASTDAPLVQELSFEADLTRAGVSSVRAGYGAEVEDNIVRLRMSDLRPRADLVLELTDATPAPDFVAWRAPHEAPMRAPNAGQMPDEDEDDYLYIPLVLPDRLFEDVSESGLDLVVVADVSAGTERSELELGRGVVEALAAHLDENDRIAVVASDVGLRGDAESLALGTADAGRVRGMLESLAREPAGGATDLGATLAEAAELLDPARSGIVVYVGDGAPTVGEMGAEGLLQRVERLASPLRAYAVAIGGDSSLELLETLTRGGGLATRVETRSAAAEAALRILAHARHPVAQRIEVELEGADQVFPRRAVDVVQGAVLPIVARVDGTYGGSVHVTGEIGGEEFDETFELTEKRAFDEGDLRLRWAGERLRQLLLGGGRREEVADLGVRYGLITPFTSFYVPSAAEMASLGQPAQHLWHDQGFTSERIPRGALAMAPLLALAGSTGCSRDEQATGSASSIGGMPGVEGLAYEEAEAPEEVMPSSAPVAAAATESADEPMDDYAPEPEPEMVERSAARLAAPAGNQQELRDEVLNQAFGDTTAEDQSGLALRGTGRGGGGTGEGTIDLGNLGTIGHGAGGGSGNGYGRGSSAMNSAAPSRPESRRRSRRRPSRDDADNDREQAIGSDAMSALGALMGEELGDGNGLAGLGLRGRSGNTETQRAEVTLRLGVTRTTHRVRHCSDAARLFLEERRNLWRERIQAANGASAWINVYSQASRDCELPAWRDRRALLTLILNRAGSVQAMIQVHRLLSSGNARSFVRHSILRRVRTPADLRVARNHFGRSHDRALIDQILDRAGVGSARVRALRQLVAQFPSDLDLKLMLLETLEQLERTEQAKRLAGELRRDPMTDPGVRTAIGEMFLRMDNEAEARRVFGEIVEFSPDDALARRRLGDLFRAHGWYEDAYRQYQTLATITPDDPSVLLLLAQAAAGAGRINEALGLEQRAAETSAPGQSQGIARTALLWSSVRFAELRQTARDEDDQDALRALASRMRRSGVLREASALRVTLVWSHPEAQLSLYGGFPGLRPTRPTDLAPEFGIEAFDVPEQEDGTYRIEVRRASAETRRGHVTAQHAKLVVVWSEGEDEEKVEVINLSFEGAERVRSFEISGETMNAVSGGGQ